MSELWSAAPFDPIADTQCRKSAVNLSPGSSLHQSRKFEQPDSWNTMVGN
jgi:hypothetical protein